MVKLNPHYQKLPSTYLFTEIERRIEVARKKHPTASFLNLGIGDVTEPLFPSVIRALQEAVQEMGDPKLFRGYGPCEGYLFLRQAIAEHDYRGLGITPDEVFISDGASPDLGNLQELFALKNRIALPDPTYPLYLDSNVMAGRTGKRLKGGSYRGVTYLFCTEENHFQPQPPAHSPIDLIYLCSPNNPTGVALDREGWKRWVDFAKQHEAVILLDGVYEPFVQSPSVPRSVYEIEGAKEVVVEVRSFSKSAGFTGLRCSYTVIPHALQIKEAGGKTSLHALWKRRHDTKFNGVAYPVQKGALALFSSEGQKELQTAVQGYLSRAKQLREGLKSLGLSAFGGIDSPYVWCQIPARKTSWEFFDHLLEISQIVALPGSGFGIAGEGYMRFSAFARKEHIIEAIQRLSRRL